MIEDATLPAEGETQPQKRRVQRLIPLGVLVAGVAAFFALGLNDYFSLDTLKENRSDLQAWTAANGPLAFVLFVVAYAIVVAFSLPGGLLMSITGGFLFGTWAATLLIVLGATAGAVGLFLAARHALGDVLRARVGGALKRFEQGFREDALSYMFVLRLVPIFPFWLVNLAPAFLGVPLRVYALTTFLGIIPGAAVYASVGAGIGAVFDAGGEADLGVIFSPAILGPLLGLAALAMVPVVYKKFMARRAAAAAGEGQ